MGLCDTFIVRYILLAGSRHRTGKTLDIIAVAHFHQSLQASAQGSVIQVKLLSVRPDYIVKTVNIGLVYLFIGSSCHAGKLSAVVAVHQHLAAVNSGDKAVGSGLSFRVVGIHNRVLLRCNGSNFRKLVQKKRSSVTQLICLAAGQLNDIYLFI